MTMGARSLVGLVLLFIALCTSKYYAWIGMVCFPIVWDFVVSILLPLRFGLCVSLSRELAFNSGSVYWPRGWSQDRVLSNNLTSNSIVYVFGSLGEQERVAVPRKGCTHALFALTLDPVDHW